jgi:hypothetical protein|tara:strand:+ start:795 stop:980 length:186 start_codon:yes stop_codon:yes gene_type:complete
MRLTKLQTIYLTQEELKAAIKLYVAHIGRHELVKRLEEESEMCWDQKGEEFIVSLDGEVEE